MADLCYKNIINNIKYTKNMIISLHASEGMNN